MPKKGYKQTEEHRKKISIANEGRKSPTYRRYVTKLEKEKISEFLGFNGTSKSARRYQACKIWEKYWNENVPKGYYIHHIDSNIHNNDISNLAMITIGQHVIMHILRKYGNIRRF